MIRSLLTFFLLSHSLVTAMKRRAPSEENAIEGVDHLFKRIRLETVEPMAVETGKLSLKDFVNALKTDNLAVLKGSIQLEEGLNDMIPFMECYDMMSPLMIASFAGSVKVCEFLISLGADPLLKSGNKDLNSIEIAYTHEKSNVLEYFRDIGLKCHGFLPGLFMKEAAKGERADTRFLNKLLAEMNFAIIQDIDSRNLLVYALNEDCNPELISILAKLMFHVDQQDPANLDVLFTIVNWIKRNKLFTNKFVLDSIFTPLCARFTPIINLKNGNGETLLYICAFEAMVDYCQVLADNGAFEHLADPEEDMEEFKSALSILPKEIAAGLYQSMLNYRNRSRVHQFFLGKSDDGSVISTLCDDLMNKIGGIMIDLRQNEDGLDDADVESYDDFKIRYLSQYMPFDLAQYIVELQYRIIQ